MLATDFDYALPRDLIAQEPLPRRTDSRMLVLNRNGNALHHRHASDIGDYLAPGDLLVLNDTRVFPARTFGHWQDTPGKMEVLFIESQMRNGEWILACKSGRATKVGHIALLAKGHIIAHFLATHGEMFYRVQLLDAHGSPMPDETVYSLLDTHGVPPVPPYIHRTPPDDRIRQDWVRYQTVYARETGSVAAPTAGLHFTPELLAALDFQGIGHTFVTLHVGPGTFRSVGTERVEDHTMASERYTLSEETAQRIRQTRTAGKRIIAVGSTTVRTLETVASEHDGEVVAAEGRSHIFIYPPYTFHIVDGMLTNFHLPKSTLLMMVSALAGRERVLDAYRIAIAERYRFYSYGDCMLIL